MLGALRRWMEARREIRLRWRADARRLVQRDEAGAYYEAQRLAALAWASGQAGEFVHSAKVAAEVARTSPRSHLDIAVVQAIVDDETRAEGLLAAMTIELTAASRSLRQGTEAVLST
ncbi:hypothetical protein [Mesorhizobium sp. 1M-11]|uniref:hypothetical protein n=1 Tax=Mesorhizobium sp. 1M-11 TaxID=1529006 RepID=UPI000AC5A444|nr:hypothetical protein [Mesorhizobium sp. 1M-11]